MNWEYKTVPVVLDAGFFAVNSTVYPEKMDALMNSLGRDRWELVSAVDLEQHGGMTRMIVLLFKRSRD